MKWPCMVVLALLVCPVVRSQPRKSNWDGWRFLVGNWVGEGSGGPGQGTGGFSFQPDLQGAVLLRKNYTEYPATKEKPAYRHEDLMIVYADPATKRTRAFYTDNEGHAIQYAATVSEDGKAITFLSDVLPSRPRYRLAYVKTQDDRVAITFEIALARKPDQFAKYIEARAHRVPDSK